MDILYLSSLCTIKEYERMFAKFGSTSSHASQKFNRMMIDGLAKNNCHIDVLTQRIPITVDNEEYQRPDELENGIRFRYLPCKKLKPINRIMTILYARREILRWNRTHSEGVVICDIILGELSIAVWLASLFHQIKAVALVTDVPKIRAGETRKGIKAIPLRIKNAIIQNYAGYIFLTEQMNAVLNPVGKPHVVIEGIVDSHVIDQPNTLTGKYDKKVCMMAGLLEDIFGVNDLVEAFRQVDNPEARLVFYGKGSSVEEINKAAEKDPRISYQGELTNKQIVSEEKKATLLVNPRPPAGEWTAYSFPSKNMEYIASGTPMLAYYLPCIPDEYLPYSFYIMDTEDRITSLKQMLESILNKEEADLFNFGKAAQEWIVQQKSAEIQTKKAVDMITRMISL